ncbi:MAG TPA: DUF1659 domain-containing protein [Tissierellaceae bacterium]|nr:DUF1659 domain-containing protein [Tissierellaceae bacterium]
MAVVGEKEKVTLRLGLDAGLVDGQQKIQTKSFTRIKTTAENEDLYNTALVLAGLQSKDLLEVKKVEESILTSQ